MAPFIDSYMDPCAFHSRGAILGTDALGVNCDVRCITAESVRLSRTVSVFQQTLLPTFSKKGREKSCCQMRNITAVDLDDVFVSNEDWVEGSCREEGHER